MGGGQGAVLEAPDSTGKTRCRVGPRDLAEARVDAHALPGPPAGALQIEDAKVLELLPPLLLLAAERVLEHRVVRLHLLQGLGVALVHQVRHLHLPLELCLQALGTLLHLQGDGLGGRDLLVRLLKPLGQVVLGLLDLRCRPKADQQLAPAAAGARPPLPPGSFSPCPSPSSRPAPSRSAQRPAGSAASCALPPT